jgi:hypothetical protein
LAADQEASLSALGEWQTAIYLVEAQLRFDNTQLLNHGRRPRLPGKPRVGILTVVNTEKIKQLAKDLRKQPPPSPHENLGGYVIATRSLVKCRAR